MNTCFFINRLLSGGAQNTLAAIVNGMYEKGEKVEILAFEPRKNKDITLNKNIKVTYLCESKNENFLKIVFKLIKFFLKSNSKIFVPTGDAGIIILSRFLSLITNKKNIPWIQFHFINSKPKNLLKKIIWNIFFINLNILDHKVIFCSKYIKKLYVENFNWKKGKFIYQAIDTDLISTSIKIKLIRKIKNKYKNEKIILAPGRIDKDKNHLSILKAINILKKDNIKFKLLIIGEKGNSLKEVKNYILKNKLNKNIRFIPLIKFQKFLNWLVAADLVVLNSSQEPIGGIAFENMFLKTNYIISYQTGWKEIIQNKNDGNVITDTFNDFEIYKRMKFVLNKKYKSNLKNKNYKFIYKNFNYREISKKWIYEIKNI